MTLNVILYLKHERMDEVLINNNINCFTFLNCDDETKCQFTHSNILLIFSVPSRCGLKGGGEGKPVKISTLHTFSFMFSIIICRFYVQINLSDEAQTDLKLRVRTRYIFLRVPTNLL
jgi:hypothetical protein